MADFSRYLPLSHRAPVDESGVSNDWRPVVAERLDRLAALAVAYSPAEWAAASRVPGATAAEVLSDLVGRLGSTRAQRFASRIGARESSEAVHPAEIPDRLRAFASSRRAGVGPHGVAELAEVVRVELALGDRLGLSPTVSGAVALHRTTSAPLPIRAAMRDRLLSPTDADWRLGAGVPLEAPAEALLLFLVGLGPVPEGPGLTDS